QGLTAQSFGFPSSGNAEIPAKPKHSAAYAKCRYVSARSSREEGARKLWSPKVDTFRLTGAFKCGLDIKNRTATFDQQGLHQLPATAEILCMLDRDYHGISGNSIGKLS